MRPFVESANFFPNCGDNERTANERDADEEMLDADGEDVLGDETF